MSLRRHTDVIAFLRREVEPVEDVYTRRAYRAAARLTDGTYLPCVTFRPAGDIVDLAVRRLAATTDGAEVPDTRSYRKTLETFVAGGSRLAAHDVARAERSPFALPAGCYEKLRRAGETSMGWVSFTGRMDDGESFFFGSPFDIAFFGMPVGYAAERMVDLDKHERHEQGLPADPGGYFKNKPFFACYLDGL